MVITNSPEETIEFAKGLVKDLTPGDVFALTGELGAGKTCFVQGLAAGLGINKKYYINSPTFTIMNIYEGGSLPLYHFDWYRLNSENDASDLGVEEFFDGKGVSVVEWAEKFSGLLPKRTKLVKIEVIGETKRRITI